MRVRAAVVSMILLAPFAGCIEETETQEEAVRNLQQAWCDADLEGVLDHVASPFYFGREGELTDDEVRNRFGAILRQDVHPNLSCPSRFDFNKLESLTVIELEARYNVTVADQVKDYEPGKDDRYVIVPPFPNPNSDDPVQGFWRPEDGTWRLIAVFG